MPQGAVEVTAVPCMFWTKLPYGVINSFMTRFVRFAFYLISRHGPPSRVALWVVGVEVLVGDNECFFAGGGPLKVVYRACL